MAFGLCLIFGMAWATTWVVKTCEVGVLNDLCEKSQSSVETCVVGVESRTGKENFNKKWRIGRERKMIGHLLSLLTWPSLLPSIRGKLF
jgi:hypothetical protein